MRIIDGMSRAGKRISAPQRRSCVRHEDGVQFLSFGVQPGLADSIGLDRIESPGSFPRSGLTVTHFKKIPVYK